MAQMHQGNMPGGPGNVSRSTGNVSGGPGNITDTGDDLSLLENVPIWPKIYQYFNIEISPGNGQLGPGNESGGPGNGVTGYI